MLRFLFHVFDGRKLIYLLGEWINQIGTVPIYYIAKAFTD